MKIDNINLFNEILNKGNHSLDAFSKSVVSGFLLEDLPPDTFGFVKELTIKYMSFKLCSLGANYSKSLIHNSIFIDCNFAKSEAFDTRFENCIFENCNFLRFLFVRCSFKNCIFNLNNDRRLIFSECRIEKVIYSCSLFNEFTVKFDDNEVVDLIYRPAPADVVP